MTYGDSNAMQIPASKWRRWRDNLNLVFNKGGPGFCHFAITNRCDARCSFCNFAAGASNRHEYRSVSSEEAFASIDILYASGIRYIEFVGGEPLLHRDIDDFITYAHRKGMHTLLCTHGGWLSRERINRLKAAGLNSVVISIDAPTADIHEKNRGIKGLCQIIRAANVQLKKCNINSTASVTISKLISDYDLLPPFLNSLGFTQLTFSYPLQYLGSGYLGFSSSDVVRYTAGELSTIFEKIEDLKKRIFVVNNRISLLEMQKFIFQVPQIFPCLGGYRYFLLNWNLDLYRCHYWEEPICRIYEFNERKFIRDHCNRCMIDCYRDASVLQYIAVSLTDACQLLKNHRYGDAFRKLFSRNNLLSVTAVAEQLPWIIKA